MALIEHFSPAVPASQARGNLLRLVRAGAGAFLGALAAGWRASVDYRQLSVMSDPQLKLRGLSRSEIPQELHQRHFGSLPSWLDAPG